MNVIKPDLGAKQPDEFEAGDLFKDEDGDVFILAQLGLKAFACISLANGNRFEDLRPSLDLAVQDLTFFARNATITITP